MRIARILYPVRVLGPGDRIGIWVSGCSRGCKGCANPELWNSTPEQEISLLDLKMTISALIKSQNKIPDGITISGGEPFDQANELYELVNYLKTFTEDILVYSGYTKTEIVRSESKARLLSQVAVLIDGEYREDQNQGGILAGSKNQQIHFQKEEIKPVYEEYLKQMDGKHLAQNFPTKNGVVSVGIHKKDFKQELEDRMSQKDFVVHNG